jgi:membrane protein YqaA with SNARE-associated domain
LNHGLIALLVLEWTRRLMAWARHVGGPGLIVLGLLDNSAIPLPGSEDVLTIILSASQKRLWPYAAAMAIIGAVIGGYITYQLASKEGKALLKRRLSARRAQQVQRAFAKWGFGAVVVPAMLPPPPPLPMFPFLLAAGALQYSRGKFLAALAIGRGIRYILLAFLAATFGRQILRRIVQYHDAILVAGIAAGLGVTLYILLRDKLSKPPSHSHQT